MTIAEMTIAEMIKRSKELRIKSTVDHTVRCNSCGESIIITHSIENEKDVEHTTRSIVLELEKAGWSVDSSTIAYCPKHGKNIKAGV